MYEARGIRPASTAVFVWRVAGHFALAGSVVLGSLGLGMWGYHRFEHLAWLDAFLNASMLLGGMGPVETPATPAGKLFAGFYALYAGLVFLVAAGIIGAPVFHRLLHKFHWRSDGPASD
jgi:hypothetical protein